MAIHKSEIQITWPTAVNRKSVAPAGNQTSEEFNPSLAGVAHHLVVKADNDGTPAANDTLDIYLLVTAGDPDGTDSDEFTTSEHARFLGQIDTNEEDPGIMDIEIGHNIKGMKLYVENNSVGRTITVSSCIYEMTA